ncbi:MAG: histidinol-phosphatase [Rectinemataceae bacterium]
MAWINYHCHCDFCDGTERPLASVEAALDHGVLSLGFSSHAPLPFPRPWCIGSGFGYSTLRRYRAEIESLKKLYRGRIDIWAGLEVDYIPGLVGPADTAFADFDYRIGAVHFVGNTREGQPWQLDDTPETFRAGLKELYGGDVRALVGDYYRSLGEMLRQDPPDIVAHFDLVKKYNRGSCYFDEGEAWYRDLVDAALGAVAASGRMLELNTGGMARGWIDESYPGPWALRRCRVLGIPVTLGSDSHRAADVDFGFPGAAAALLAAGYEEIMVLSKGGWQPMSFGEHGLKPWTRELAA